MATYQPGQFNRRIQVWYLGQVPDGGGGYDNQLLPLRTVWAYITPLQGSQFWQSQETEARVSHKIVIRYTPDINRSHVVSFNGKYYDIQFIFNVNEESRFLELQVLERVQ